MAPSSGHLLVPKLIRIIKFGISKSTDIVKSKLPQSTQPVTAGAHHSVQPAYVYCQNQPVHPIARLKQSCSSNQTRWFSSPTRTFVSSTKSHTPRYDRSQFPVSKTSKIISQRGVTPFASTLRPNLTGGALPRSAGGYGLSGAGVRHFSHTSGAQAQVLQNVSTGIRAFLIGGGKARFDGVDPITGEKRFRSVSQTEDAVYTKWKSPLARSMRGTNLVFQLSPSITALAPVFSSSTQQSALDVTSLHELNLLDNLATDFARALKDLAAILADLRGLASFGDLPISVITTSSGPVLQVRFPGCDGDLVSRLCDEASIRRGVIVEDEAWTTEKDVEMALLFPFAPIGSDASAQDTEDGGEYFERQPRGQPYQPDELEWRNMLSPSTPHTPPSTQSRHTLSPPRKLTAPSDYESLRDSDFAFDDPHYHYSSPLEAPTHSTNLSGDYEGVEGIYKFLQECEDSRR
ncbi:hypothetical protein ACLMJK_004008 [Lecanora helva]